MASLTQRWNVEYTRWNVWANDLENRISTELVERASSVGVRSFSTLWRSLVFYVSEGYFQDPSPAPFDRYRGTPVKSRDVVGKERQMLAGPSRDLFEEKFARIFYGEALHEPWRVEAKERVMTRRNCLEFVHYRYCLSMCHLFAN